MINITFKVHFIGIYESLKSSTISITITISLKAVGGFVSYRMSLDFTRFNFILVRPIPGKGVSCRRPLYGREASGPTAALSMAFIIY
jgi:hypothetical protein